VRIYWLFLTTSLSFGMATGAHIQSLSPGSPSVTPSPKITVINLESIPVQLDSARVAVENGQVIIECKVTNTSNQPIVRVETTLLVYNEAGRREGLQLDDVAQEGLPIQPHSNGALRIPVRTVAIQGGDQLRLGMTTAVSATDIWANSRFVAESDAAFAEGAARETASRREDADPLEPIVINHENAPASVVDVVVVRTASGAPIAVHATVRNRLWEALLFNEVEVFVFNSKGVIRIQAFKPDRSPIPASASRTHQININGIVEKAIVVVTLARAATLTQKWQNRDGMEEARAAVLRMPHSLGERH
jgi:hypothetical protein